MSVNQFISLEINNRLLLIGVATHHSAGSTDRLAEQTENGNGFGVQPIRKKLAVLKDVDVEKPVPNHPKNG